jgi:hypothetical protein
MKITPLDTVKQFHQFLSPERCIPLMEKPRITLHIAERSNGFKFMSNVVPYTTSFANKGFSFDNINHFDQTI